MPFIDIYFSLADILSVYIKLMPATFHNKTHKEWSLSVHSNELERRQDLRLYIKLKGNGKCEYIGVLNSLYQCQEIHSFSSVLAKGTY